MFKTIKNLYQISASYRAELDRIIHRIDALQRQVTDAVNLIKERTEMGADISNNRYDPSFVVLVGRYGNRDYVRLVTLHPQDLGEVIRHVEYFSRQSGRRRIDAEPGLRKMVIERLDPLK